MNVKKAQLLAPWDMANVVDKCRVAGNRQVMVCERGTFFGYDTLVCDMRSLALLRRIGCPVVFDTTHSVQLSGADGAGAGAQREMVPVLARAAVAAGVAGLFMETHPDPERALCDGASSWPLGRVEELVATLLEIDRVVKARPYAERVR